MKEIKSLDNELRQIKSKIESMESSEIPRLEIKLAEADVELNVISKQRNKLFDK